MSSADAIEKYLSSYRQGYIGYAAAATYIQDACRSALSSSGILASVSSRAKDADRLKTKLEKMEQELKLQNPQKPNEVVFKSPKDIEDKIVDIIGVRVLLYFPSQVAEVIAQFDSLFPDAVLEEKLLTDTKVTGGAPITAQKIMETFSKDEAMKSVGTNPGPLTEQSGEYKSQYGSYRAVHIRFTMNPLSLGTEVTAMLTGRLKVEIQIQTLLMHSWSEVSHDILYKPLSGKPSAQEYQLLDCLNGVGKLGELVVTQVKNTMDVRQKNGKGGFDSPYELAQFIGKEVQDTSKGQAVVMGDVDDLLDFLKDAKKNNRSDVSDMIAATKKPIAENTADPKVADRERFNNLLPVVDILLRHSIGKKAFTFETPFLLEEQNAKFKTVTKNNKYEVFATIFDLACRPILQSVPEKLLAANLQFPLAFRTLQDASLYDDKKPVMPKKAFPVNRSKLTDDKVGKAIEGLVKYFSERLDNAIVLHYLRHAQIRAWKLFGNKDFSKDFS